MRSPHRMTDRTTPDHPSEPAHEPPTPDTRRLETVPGPYEHQAAPAPYGHQAAPGPYERQAAPAPYERQAAPGPYESRTAPAPCERPAAPNPYGGRAAPNPYEELGELAGPLDDFLRPEEPPFAGADDEGTPWSAPDHRRRPRLFFRFAGIPFALKAVIALVTLLAFLALGDRWAVLYAEHTAAEKLKDAMHLEATPEVSIGGFPFVTQVLGKHLGSVTVTVPDVAADRVSLAKVSATADDIRLSGDLPTSLKGAFAGKVRGEVLLSFDDLNRELGASQVTFSGTGRDRVLARGTLPVAGHDVRVRADARITRDGTRGIRTEIGGIRLSLGDLATFRPGTGPADGLHLTEKSAKALREQTAKVKALFGVREITRRLGVPPSAVGAALRSDERLHEVTGTPRFVHDLMRINLVDAALDHPELLRRLGLDPGLLTSLSTLTRPQLADRLTLGFHLPELPTQTGDVNLSDVRVTKEGIHVRLEGDGVGVSTK
ncbi:LmeA family phospholipid-binding protein [Streptomyces sp. NPDC088925]|uniref:LmeA family phospholipid-binding protein n=1 Tax=Streptomyces sp. NPDC088925 TaxID=3365914 RepID=UPI0037F57F94